MTAERHDGDPSQEQQPGENAADVNEEHGEPRPLDARWLDQQRVGWRLLLYLLVPRWLCSFYLSCPELSAFVSVSLT